MPTVFEKTILASSEPVASTRNNIIKPNINNDISSIAKLDRVQNRPINTSTSPLAVVQFSKTILKSISFLCSPIATYPIKRIFHRISYLVFTESSLYRRISVNARYFSSVIGTLISALQGGAGATIHLVGSYLRLPSEAFILLFQSEILQLFFNLDNVAGNEVLLHPIPIDPIEQIYLTIDANLLLSPVSEIINSAVFAPSSEAIIDSHSLVDSGFDSVTRKLWFKPTGGLPDTQYPWIVTINTTDINGRIQNRKRTILVRTLFK